MRRLNWTNCMPRGYVHKRIGPQSLTKGELEYLKDHADKGVLELAEILKRPVRQVARSLALLKRHP